MRMDLKTSSSSDADANSSGSSDSSDEEVIEESFVEKSVDQTSINISDTDSEAESSNSEHNTTQKSENSLVDRSAEETTRDASTEKSKSESISYSSAESEGEVVESDDENSNSKEKSRISVSRSNIEFGGAVSQSDEENEVSKVSDNADGSNDNTNTSVRHKSANKTDVDSPIMYKRSKKKPLWNLDSEDESFSVRKSINASKFDNTKRNFEISITKKLSSTISEDANDSNEKSEVEERVQSPPDKTSSAEKTAEPSKENETGSSDKSVEIVSADPVMISILSAPSNVRNECSPNMDENFKNSKKSGDFAKFGTPGMKYSTPVSGIQKKITEFMQPPLHSSEKIKPKDEISLTYISNQEKKLDDLKVEYEACKRVVENLAISLPDNGKKMKDRFEHLKKEIIKQSNYIRTLYKSEESKNDIASIVIDDSFPGPSLPKSSESKNDIASIVVDDSFPGPSLPKSSEPVVMSHDIPQPVATPFTLECLKEICGTLETCPPEDVLADEPKGLKISLMNHQRHALVWMNWRETQKPRGGILADDMGLGKTLTMISLILDAKQKKEAEEDEENERHRKRRRGGTLVVCTASLIGQWNSEIENRVRHGLLTTSLHHGNNRETKAKYLCHYDVVITTYGVVSRECKSDGALFDVKWERIILDEAHTIRNHKSQVSDGCCQLRGKYRWALTGTPIQNKEMDAYALLKFLRCTPFDELANWKIWINKNSGGTQRLAMIMKAILLRRTKADLMQKNEIKSLPEKKTELIEFELEKEEMDVYQKVLAFSQKLFAQFLHQQKERYEAFSMSAKYRPITQHGGFCEVHKKVALWNQGQEVKSHEILVLLLRLRQICCHPGLISQMIENMEVETGIEDCDKENEPTTEINILEQMEKLQIGDDNPVCICSEIFGALQGNKNTNVFNRSNKVFDLSRASSKIKKVLDVLEEKVLNTSDKAIIVSQWTGVLDLLKPHLTEKGIKYTSLTGRVPVPARPEIVSSFNDPYSKDKIMLLSLSTGGVGLNLIGANHLFLVDPHWNPQLENQAQDRVYRFGQKKPVNIYKFVSKETVEERIKTLQDQKMAIADGVLSGTSKGEWTKLKLEDLKGLFGMS